MHGEAKVHFNGLFTQPFPLHRGVHQGCPLAPLLFALSSQPLMLFLKDHATQGNISGIPIMLDQSLLHQLFADTPTSFSSPPTKISS